MMKKVFCVLCGYEVFEKNFTKHRVGNKHIIREKGIFFIFPLIFFLKKNLKNIEKNLK